jgi:hypothetical protein
VYHDAAYVKWANESTIHVMSYSLDKEQPKPEPLVTVERDGEKVEVLAMYPALTPNEAVALVNELDGAVKFPTSTPWAGVISSTDGATVLAELKKGTAAEFRALYEAEQKKLGAVLPRDVWKNAVKALSDSTEAEFDDRVADAVKAALVAKSLVPSPTKAMGERLAGRVEALERLGRERLEKAQAEKDPAKRTAALAAVAKDFAGLAVAEDAAKAK